MARWCLALALWFNVKYSDDLHNLDLKLGKAYHAAGVQARELALHQSCLRL